jgi:hypothetical protein
VHKPIQPSSPPSNRLDTLVPKFTYHVTHPSVDTGTGISSAHRSSRRGVSERGSGALSLGQKISEDQEGMSTQSPSFIGSASTCNRSEKHAYTGRHVPQPDRNPSVCKAEFYLKLYCQMINDIMEQDQTITREGARWRACQIITLSLLKGHGTMAADLRQIQLHASEWQRLESIGILVMPVSAPCAIDYLKLYFALSIELAQTKQFAKTKQLDSQQVKRLARSGVAHALQAQPSHLTQLMSEEGGRRLLEAICLST